MKIICIGRNYMEHVKELSRPAPSEPVFFLKPDTALLRNNQPFFLPDFSQLMHYETELVLKICRLGRNIAEKYAHKYYDEIGLGVDFTARDLQQNCIEKGLPWEISKAFDNSAPLGKFRPVDSFRDIRNIEFHLNINGTTVQKGNSGEMIFSFERIISHVSRFFTLKTGDLIFTGTPVGVGPVKIGDRLDGYLEGERMFAFSIK